jgi:hypothetical protein
MGAINPKKMPKPKKHKASQKPNTTLPPVFDPNVQRDV